MPESFVYKLVSTALIAAMISSASAQVDKSRYSYIDQMGGDSIYFDIWAGGALVGIHDVSTRATELCAASTGYHCIAGAGFKFAVPRVVSSNQTQWLYADRTYRLVERVDEIRILGRIFRNVIVIESSAEKVTPLRFIFSTSSGLLLFGYDGGATYLLVQSCGFGHDLDCQ